MNDELQTPTEETPILITHYGDFFKLYGDPPTYLIGEGNCEVDTIDRMQSFAEGIHRKRLSYDNLIGDNGLSARVVKV